MTVWTVEDLVVTLSAASEPEYVRVVASWLTHGQVEDSEPSRTGDRIVDVLVSATVAHLAREQGRPVPAWTLASHRVLDRFWHPGDDRFFARALVHAPAEFAARGVFIDAESLVSV